MQQLSLDLEQRPPKKRKAKAKKRTYPAPGLRLGVIRWWGPCLAEHHDSRTIWMMGVLKRAYELRKETAT